MIKYTVITIGSENTQIHLTASPRDPSFVYKAGYITFASSVCPEFTGDCLYVWGENAAYDADIIDIPNDFMPQFKAAIAEINAVKFGETLTHSYEICCGHFYIAQADCACNNQPCAMCGTVDNKRNQRAVEHGDVTYYICKSHKKTIKCPVCDDKVYFLKPHDLHGSLQCCLECKVKPVSFGTQHSYSYRPMPIFHDVHKGEVVKYTQETVKKNKHLKTKFWTGHEVEQQFPRESNRGLLIGRMHDKQGDFIYCKHDGSIGNGTECVTMPFSWDFFKHHDWEGILNPHLTDWRTSGSSVGQHVHMSMDSFSRLHLYNFLKFHHTHLKWVEYISQRPLTNYCLPTGGAMTKALNKGMGGTKYEFLNITGPTMEWRAFASPVTLEEFKKNNEYLHAVYTWTKMKSPKDLSAARLEEFIFAHKKTYPNLVAFLELKNAGDLTKTRHISNTEGAYRKFTTKSDRQALRRQSPRTCARCLADYVSLDYDSPNGDPICENCYDSYCEEDAYDSECVVSCDSDDDDDDF